jgi:outer membrane protein insertion porin family
VTGDDMVRMVAFCDFGTVEPSVHINWRDFRVAPGLGLRIQLPALGPAPIALDFAVPVQYAPNDLRQVFSFFVGYSR